MPTVQVWSQTEDGYVTELSALRPREGQPAALMPETTIPFPFVSARFLMDYSNNHILGWYYFFNQKKYVVFNE